METPFPLSFRLVPIFWSVLLPSVVWNEGLGLYVMVNGGTYAGHGMTSSDNDYYDSWMHERTGSLGLRYSKNPYGPWHRVPRIFHGADRRLVRPASGKWFDTEPIVTEASEAILAAARGASPDNPVWVLPVGPCTNIASAILQARRRDLDLGERIRICWLGGGPKHAHQGTFNGRNDPWSVYVAAQSGVDFWVLLEKPTGASLTLDKRVESDLYPDNPLGEYLETITPARKKALYDLTTISTVIGDHLGKMWLTQVEPSTVLGPDQEYRWKKTDEATSVYVIRDIDEAAMKEDFFNTLNGQATGLLEAGE